MAAMENQSIFFEWGIVTNVCETKTEDWYGFKFDIYPFSIPDKYIKQILYVKRETLN
jgi:hypothetical protein